MVNIFTKIIEKGAALGIVPNKTQEARDWFRNQAKRVQRNGVKRLNETALMNSDPSRQTNIIMPGSMVFFMYDAKHKDTLPYWDRVPLIIPISKGKDYFIGLNFHYLPPVLRAKLLDGLYDYASNPKYDDTTRFKLSYQLLKSAAKLKYFKPCIKKYLIGHMDSRFFYIHPNEWEIAIWLPLARFQGATNQKVWADARKALR